MVINEQMSYNCEQITRYDKYCAKKHNSTLLSTERVYSMAFEIGLDLLNQLQVALIDFKKSQIQYDEAPLQALDDTAYSAGDGLLQAIWNIAHHLKEGMTQGNLVTYIGWQMLPWPAGLASGPGTIFPSLDYLHRGINIKQPQNKPYQWVPEVVDDRTYQLSLAFRNCLAQLSSEEPDLQSLLGCIPLAQMIVSLDERLLAYQTAHLHAKALPVIFSTEEPIEPENASISDKDANDDDSSQDSESAHREEQLEEAQQMIEDLEKIVDEYPIPEKAPSETLDHLKQQAHDRRKKKDETLKQRKVTQENLNMLEVRYSHINADKIHQNCEPLLDALELEGALRELYREKLLNMHYYSMTQGSMTLLGTVTSLFTTTPEAQSKNEILAFITNKQQQLREELEIELESTPSFSKPLYIAKNNLFELQQQYHKEQEHQHALTAQKIEKDLNELRLQTAILKKEMLELQFYLQDMEKLQVEFDEAFTNTSSVDDHLTIIDNRLQSLTNLLASTGKPKRTHRDLLSSESTLSIELKKIESQMAMLPNPMLSHLTPIQTRLNVEIEELREANTQRVFVFQTFQTSHDELTRQSDALELSKLHQIELNSRLDDTTDTVQNQYTRVQQQIHNVHAENSFIQEILQRSHADSRLTFERIVENTARLKSKKNELKQELIKENRAALLDDFFGAEFFENLKDSNVQPNDKLFTKYIKQRNQTYFYQDWMSMGLAMVLGVFGYTSERLERERYISELQAATEKYVNNTDDDNNEELLDVLRDVISDGQLPGVFRPYFFSSRAAGKGQKFHPDSFQYLLDKFETRLNTIEPLKPAVTKKTDFSASHTKSRSLSMSTDN